jgi:uncharacterized protein
MDTRSSPIRHSRLPTGLLRTAERFVQNPIVIFLAASVVFGSLTTWLLAAIPSNPTILPLLALPISYIPALLAVLVLRRGGSAEEWQAFRRRLTTWQVGLRWYGIALLLLPLIHLGGVALANLWGGHFPLHPERLLLLPLFLFTNLGEEIGWRGYALPRLQQRFGSLTASLIVGVAWAAFHWVALLQNPTLPWGYFAVGSVMLIAMSVVMTWMFNQTKQSVVIATAVHAMYDAVSIGVVPLSETASPLLAFAFSAGLMCLVAVALVLLHGVDLGKTAKA